MTAPSKAKRLRAAAAASVPTPILSAPYFFGSPIEVRLEMANDALTEVWAVGRVVSCLPVDELAARPRRWRLEVAVAFNDHGGIMARVYVDARGRAQDVRAVAREASA